MSEEHILQIIRNHPAGFYKVYPDRIVNNIYFDTPDLTCYKDNIKGISNRKKFRVRWYGEQSDIVKSPKFEIKLKENMLGAKKTFDMSDFQLDDLELLTKEIDNLALGQYCLRPTLFNSYSRSYWETRCAKFRITLDTNMKFHGLLHSPLCFKLLCADAANILELKYEDTEELEMNRIADYLPFRTSRNSKYVNGILITF